MIDRATDRFRGVIVPLVTPLTPAGEIDLAAADRLVEHVIAGGVHGVFVLGTTGESASIELSQRQVLVERVASRLAGRVTFYAGVSATALQDSIDQARRWAASGVDAVVAHPPGYFSVSAIALEKHMLRLADAIALPLVIYDIPRVTHCELSIDSILRVADHPRVAGLKDSTGNEQRVRTLIDRLAGRSDFSLQLGSTALFGAFLRGGGPGISGIVPSSANLDPRLYRDLFDASERGDDVAIDQLQKRNEALVSIFQSNTTLGESIARLKRQLAAHGLCGPDVLPPLLLDEEGAR